MNTNLYTIPVIRSNHPDIGLVIIFCIGLLILVTLGYMAYLLLKIKYGKYLHRKHMKSKTKIFTEESIQKMYAEIRDKHNDRQLEFPFVKAIDDAYIVARYNINVDTE